jgi:beta-galactosidase
VKHVAALTNCDTVKLYLNSEAVRVSTPDRAGDSITHFWLPYRPGVLRAEGYRNGVKVIEDILHTTKRPSAVEIIAPVKAAPGDVITAEIWLKDKYGEPWVLDNPLTEIRLNGDAELMALDNGNMCSAEAYSSHKRTFWNGHLLAIIRAGNSKGTLKITAETENMNTVSRDIIIA